MTERIGFVGVGRMGSNMARRLKDCGYPVTAVYDLRKDAAAALAQELGCGVATTLSEVTEAAEVIVTVVTDDKAMAKIFTPGKGGLLRNASGKLFINCATVSPEAQIGAYKAAKKAGADALEGCMAASITQAREGTLYLMCGGDEQTFNRARPLLEKLSSNLRYIGPIGQAARVKLLVNMVMNINTAGLAEGLALADALKLDLAMVREVFSQTGANSRVLQTDGEGMQTSAGRPRDLRQVLECGSPLPLWIWIAILALSFSATAAEVRCLPNAHAHNDYLHTRPLLDALDQGFCSVEADIHLVNGKS